MSEQEQVAQDAMSASHTQDASKQPPDPLAEKEITPSLEEMLRQAELNAQEHHDAWLRAKAETENVRRRALEDVEKARKFAMDKFAGDLLAVKDSLEAALGTGDTASVESLKSGVELTLKQLVSAFDKNNINEINPIGDKLDPNYHQAIGMVDGEGEANTVAQVLQKGYALNERILRPALVMVTKPRG